MISTALPLWTPPAHWLLPKCVEVRRGPCGDCPDLLCFILRVDGVEVCHCDVLPVESQIRPTARQPLTFIDIVLRKLASLAGEHGEKVIPKMPRLQSEMLALAALRINGSTIADAVELSSLPADYVTKLQQRIGP